MTCGPRVSKVIGGCGKSDFKLLKEASFTKVLSIVSVKIKSY